MQIKHVFMYKMGEAKCLLRSDFALHTKIVSVLNSVSEKATLLACIYERRGMYKMSNIREWGS